MDKTHSDSPFLTKQETALYLRRSLRKLEEFIKTGQLVPVKLDRKLLFAVEFDRFVEHHRVVGTAPHEVTTAPHEQSL